MKKLDHEAERITRSRGATLLAGEVSRLWLVICPVYLPFIRVAYLPWIALGLLAISALAIASAWQAARGLALRWAVAWAGLAVALAIVAQVVALAESPSSGRPDAGRWAYVASLASLAALISVFGARTPGAGAWGLLMGMLVLVLLIPWLEGWGLRSGRSGSGGPTLDAPWSIFFALLALAGIANYLPTRFGLASILVGGWLLVEFLALTIPGWTPATRGRLASIGPTFLALGLIRAWGDARRAARGSGRLERGWLRFRNAWGVVWALRVRERFNRAAEASRWPIRLGWDGVEPAEPGVPSTVPPEAEATFAGLIRRFDPSGSSGPC